MDRDSDGWAAVEAGGDDCDDSDPEVSPDAVERCDDGIDNDCNGRIDDFGEGNVLWYFDGDQDGFGIDGVTRLACSNAVIDGWALEGGDCDDVDDAVSPGQPDDDCDGVDDNCDGTPDEGAQLYYPDLDGDGAGDQLAEPSCERVDGWVANRRDCDDRNESVLDEAAEVCDGLDNDCDGEADEGGVASVGEALYAEVAPAIEAALADGGATVRLCAQEASLTLGTFDVAFGQVLAIEGPPVPAGDEPAVSLGVPAEEPLFDVQEGGVLRLARLVVEGGISEPALTVDGRLSLDHVVARANRAGVMVVGGSVLSTNCEFLDNGAAQGAVMWLRAGASAGVTGGSALGNVATDPGGGLAVLETDAELVVDQLRLGESAEANAPEDVLTPLGPFDFEAGLHSFSCVGGVCQ